MSNEGVCVSPLRSSTKGVTLKALQIDLEHGVRSEEEDAHSSIFTDRKCICTKVGLGLNCLQDISEIKD